MQFLVRILLLSALFGACAYASCLEREPKRNPLPSPSTPARPQSDRRQLSSTEWKPLSFPVRSQQIVARGEETARLLLQSNEPISERPAGECSLSTEDVRRYLDAATRTWIVDEAIFDVQSVVDCTRRDDVILFNSSRVIRPSTRIVIPWNLTLGSYVDEANNADGVFPRSQNKARFTCPQANEGLFLVRSRSVTFSDVVFSGCVFNAPDEVRSVIEVEKCRARRRGTVRLRRVTFAENELSGAVALAMAAPSCSRVELIDVNIENNTCAHDGCAARLSLRNRIDNCRLVANTLAAAHSRFPSLFSASPGSRTEVKGLSADRNELSVLRTTAGSLTLKNSSFSQNTVKGDEIEGVFRSCIDVTKSSVVVEDSRFQSNKGHFGGLMLAKASNVSFSYSTFQNQSAVKGGVVYAEDRSAISLESCRFISNNASEDGGSLRSVNSSLTVRDCDFVDGYAGGGGFLSLQRSSATVHRSDFTRGSGGWGGCIEAEVESQLRCENVVIQDAKSGQHGGAIYAHNNASVSFLNATFLSNTATLDGNCIFADEAHVFVKRSEAIGNIGQRFGAFVSARRRSTVQIEDSSFLNNSAGGVGGVAVVMSSSWLKMQNSFLSGNKAAQQGGVVYVDTASNLSIVDCRLEKSSAETGGFVSALGAGIVEIVNSSLTDGSADTGGSLVAVDGTTMLVQNSTIAFCKGKDGGGAMHAFNATVIIQTVAVLNCTSEGAGGAINCISTCQLRAMDSVFARNSATFGGAVVLEESSIGQLTGCYFSQNLAQRNGAGLYVEGSNASLSRCTFVNGSAPAGGSVSLISNARVNVTDSSFSYGLSQLGGGVTVHSSQVQMHNVSMEKNVARIQGGALVVGIQSAAYMKDAIFRGNRALQEGGAVMLLEAVVFVGDGLVFSESSAGGRGGGSVFSQRSRKIQIANAQFYRNLASAGGAVRLNDDEDVSFINSSFDDNSAATLGGVCSVENALLSFTNCSMRRNSAVKRGGCIALTNSTLNIANSTFVSSRAAEFGGFIAASELSDIRVTNTTLENMSSLNGGAVWLDRSMLKQESVLFSNCKANASGGAVNAIRGSRFLCNDCIFESNVAGHTGGAVHLSSGQSAQLISLQFDRCVFRDNSARHGGAVGFVRDSKQHSCTSQSGNCSFMILMDTRFVRNGAGIVGGAIFASDIDSIRMRCSVKQRQTKREFYGRADLEALDSLSTINDICPAWKGNNAGSYADDVGARGSLTYISVITEDGGASTRVSGNRFIVEDHESGKPLPVIQLEVVDALGQGPAIGLSNETIEAVMTSPEDFFSGSVNILLLGGTGKFEGVVGFGPKGTYRCIIRFREELIEPFVIEVHIRGCRIGEVAGANGTLCEPCASDTYNVRPEDGNGCRPCPEDGNCTSHVILPKKGYWNPTPCSKNVQRCLAPEACEAEHRDRDLKAITKDVETCDLDEEYVTNYTKAQCRKGHEGPMCGSCQNDYGKSYSSLCEKCLLGFGSFALVFLSFLILMGLSGITIRSNRISTTSTPSKKQAASPQSSAPPSRSNSVPVNEQMVEMMVTGHVPEEILYPTRTPMQTPSHHQPADDAVLLKWKAVEVFKITVNFLQVTAIAIAVNVRWTLGMVYLFNTAEFISGIASEAVNRSVECLLPAESSLERSVAGTLIDVCQPLAAIFTFSIIWFANKIRRNESMGFLLKKIVLSVLVVFNITYISISKTLVKVLNCIEVNDSPLVEADTASNYWAVDTHIRCYEGSHVLLACVVGWPFLFIFTFGFPLTVAYLVVNYIADDYQEGWIYDVSGFMYRSYRKKFVFWESVIMLRKAVLAVVVVFSYPLGANLQQVLCVFALILALYAQMICRPFRSEFDSLNEMESASILVSLLTFVSSVFFIDERVSSAVRLSVTVGSASINTTLLLCFLRIFFIFSAQYLRTVLDTDGVFYNPNLGYLHIFRVYIFNHLLERLKHAVVSLFCSVRANTASRRLSV